MPFCRVEVAVMGIIKGQLSVLLVRRANEPFQGKLGLVGGVVRIDLDNSLDAAAHRVMNERTGLKLPFIRQMCAEGGPTRDPRVPWALSVVFRALAEPDQLRPVAGKRVLDLVWCHVDEVGASATLAFDHAKLIAQAVSTTRKEVEHLILPAGFIPEKFTLGELQRICEQILGHRLDKTSFRRKLADKDLVQPIEGEMRGGAYRPAQVHRLIAR